MTATSLVVTPALFQAAHEYIPAHNVTNDQRSIKSNLAAAKFVL